MYFSLSFDSNCCYLISNHLMQLKYKKERKVNFTKAVHCVDCIAKSNMKLTTTGAASWFRITWCNWSKKEKEEIIKIILQTFTSIHCVDCVEKSNIRNLPLLELPDVPELLLLEALNKRLPLACGLIPNPWLFGLDQIHHVSLGASFVVTLLYSFNAFV